MDNNSLCPLLLKDIYKIAWFSLANKNGTLQDKIFAIYQSM